MDKYDKRQYIIGAAIVSVIAVFIVKLFLLQVVDNSYNDYATNNVLRRMVNYPARGLIYDRHGKLLVHNKAAYDLLVIPRELVPFDTTELCRLVGIEKAELIESLAKAKKYSRYKQSVIVRQLSPEAYAVLQEKLFKFRGFFVQTRTLREYPQNIASHMLGYVGEVNKETIDKDPYYQLGDYIGITGIEQVYEEELRGRKGVNFYLVDVHNRPKGLYKEGAVDTAAILGNNLIATIDADLQLYVEQLMVNKRGAVVAIEPASGEVLAIYSGPAYDPNLLVGRERGNNYRGLLNDTLKPLNNKAIASAYSPGSTFKLLNALIALQEQAITPNTAFRCDGEGSSPIRCTHYHETPITLKGGIRESCNPYFWNTFRSIIGKFGTAEEGYKVWADHMRSFGLGQTLGSDFPGQLKGNIPTPEYYDRYFGKNRWNAQTIRSLSIGQGEIILTPLQMANTAAIIANRGHYTEPHLIKAVANKEGDMRNIVFERKECSVKPEYFEEVIEGMSQVVERTNTRYTAFVEGLDICGKTGTIQNSHGSNHSAFVAFAPRDNPQIAIAVYVEFGVYGARHAAPIASLIIEKYLNGHIGDQQKAREKKMLETNLLNPIQPK